MDLRLLISEDGGGSWHKAPIGHHSEGCDVFTVSVDPGNSNVVYMTDGEVAVTGNYGNVWRSPDKGTSWNLLSTKTPDAGLPYGKYRTFVIDPSSALNARTLYTACIREASESQVGGIFKSTDGGSSWIAANAGLPPQYRHVVTMAIDPFDSQHLWAGVPVWFQYGTGGLFVSHDGGASWAATATSTLRSVWKVVPDPNRPGIVWAATSSEFAGGLPGGVFRSIDSGVTFTRTSTDMPDGAALWVTDLAIDPRDSNVLAATTGEIIGDVPGTYGVWLTRDGGQTWTPSNVRDSVLDTYSIFADPVVNGRFFLGTAGNGLFSGMLR